MRSYFSQQPDLRFLVFHAKLHEHNEKKIENISSGFSFLVNPFTLSMHFVPIPSKGQQD